MAYYTINYTINNLDWLNTYILSIYMPKHTFLYYFLPVTRRVKG